jgi:hypothetical protein
MRTVLPDERDEDGDREQHDGDGGAVAGVPDDDAFLVNQVAQRCRHVVRAALAQLEELREGLQGADRGDDDHERGHGPQLRPGDVPELPPRAAAVDAGRLAVLLGNDGEPAEEHDGGEARLVPQAVDDHGGHGAALGLDPLRDRQVQAAQHPVGQAELRVENPGPDERGRDQGGRVREVDGQPRGIDGPAAALQQQGEGQGDGRAADDHRAAEVQRVPQAGGEARIRTAGAL